MRPKHLHLRVPRSLLLLAAAALVAVAVGLACGGGEDTSQLDDMAEQFAQVGERETVQILIQNLMIDNDLSAVTASTSAAGGEKITNASTQFHATITMANYMDQASTQYCYRWATNGLITFQYDLVGGACAAIGTQLYP